ncbi:hypothetical protein K431DRAFT_315076 [Polychaeton citri CBS 116435]|uniref:Uncharacterized protein n=1 Tax=Polychaeton citri CBS 116435 TaxID=1314669 RepID=A0A9P4Q2I4_9PEZI|nr:hypothetical protein K431DRAFT_315076 [Polychaeton citri CBS 116435]
MEAAIRWSQHPSNDTQRFLLVDTADSSLSLNQLQGLRKHKVSYSTIAKATKLPNFGAFDHSKTDENVVAIGQLSGNASLLRFGSEGKASELVKTYKVRQQRKCNSISLSSQNWLAVALEKIRSDVCLNIYDANDASIQEPVRRLCAAEVVSSVRFFPSQPQEIVAAAQRAFLRIYDLRDGSNTSPSLQTTTKCVNNIALDPLDENYFASAGSTDDPSVTVWDKRWLYGSSSAASVSSVNTGLNSGAVFEFRPAVNNSIKTTVWSLRYSGQRRGRLAICSSTGELKIIDMVESSSSSTQESAEYAPSNALGGSAWPCNRYVSQSRSLERPWHDPIRRKEASERIIAFDWARSLGYAHEQPVLTLRPDRSVGTINVPLSQPLASFTGRYDISITSHDELTFAEPKLYGSLPGTPSKRYQRSGSVTAEDFGPLEYQGEAESQLYANSHSASITASISPSTLFRERCKQGYLFDCQRNMGIVAGHWHLERLWEIIGRFETLAEDDQLVSEGIDFSFIGVSGLWYEKVGRSPQRFLSQRHASVYEAISNLNSALEIPPFEGERTGFPEHRQLCLLMCGWQFTPDALEEECQELIDRGLYYQAVVQAVLHNDKRMALNFLRTLIRSKTIPNIGLNALLAADKINNEQREMCEWMAADTEDKSLKALLTFLITGHWRDVMRLNYLHLGYRMCLGLRYLNDTELANFIQFQTTYAIQAGDLEGILLTGLSEQAMSLLQNYLTKTGDLQTAVLASAFTNPKFVDDVRWQMWKETYFGQMQRWRCFVERAKFTVQHNRMARTREGKTLVEPPKSQIRIRCMHCNADIARSDGRYLSGKSSSSATAQGRPTKSQAPAFNAGTVCPSCGRHLPRCGICMKWLGTPDPLHAMDANREDAKDELMAKFLTFCVSCGHGYHANHARNWFLKHQVCAVPDCECLCAIKSRASG